ncbi:uncharacterized protein LOC123540597 isoform X2 [Mercenaria mercenaria]|uniref:uncharacterized protein LOC123540597 isoform X2 n=1 Tax=Mercenaria mercenaria TaxID=6596 RepID=UPI00234FB3D1|nr:uncharacterized protein LOC123540597 isoform X2 [Mercenaria mercenaria]
MEITKYNVPEQCFPRYQYSKKIREDLAKRYNDLMKRLKRVAEPLEDKSDLNDKEICIFLCKDLSSKYHLPNIQSIVSRKSDIVTNENTSSLEGPFRKNTFVITNRKNDISKSIKGFEEHIIVIASDETDKQALLETFKHYEHVDVCTAENVCDALSTRLERYAFSGMKTACECLDYILMNRKSEHFKTQHDHEEKASVTSEITDKGRHISDKNDQNLGSSSTDTTSVSGNKRTAKEQGKVDSTKSQRSIAVLIKENMESIERLYDEIVGMFNRSNLPETEFPDLCYKMNKKINGKLLEELQKMSDTIQSCGYRFSTFLIYTKDGLCSEELSQKINRVLEEHGITEYSIVTSDINTFSTCHVGKKIAVKDTKNDRKVCGTLGGFAHTSSGESERNWALISRHVASCSSDRNLYVENGEERVVAKIMKQIHEGETEKQYLDIAAACLENDVEIGYDTRYITEENVLVPGKLCNYDTEKLRGLPVHIKGASTPLGLGTVTIPEQSSVQNYDLGENYVVVEDREEHGAFCKEGDSGAIVCAEHPDKYGEEVQLISMVVGENCGRKGSYATVRLDKGLAQLKTLTEKEFYLS